MSGSDTPDQDPKTQPKWSGGPPRPPKITKRGLEDESPEAGQPIVDFIEATEQADRLLELLESIRGSGVVALNRLEAELDVCIVALSKGGQVWPVVGEVAMRHLETIRTYRNQNPRLGTGGRELREQARRILDGIKKYNL
jgi:hypothetical protein